MDSIPTPWLIVGFTGQAFFTMRFLVQWLYTEKLRRSVVPQAFWYFSIGGGATLLVYAIYRQDPVIIVGQLFGLLVYSRNLYFVCLGREPSVAAPQTSASTSGSPPGDGRIDTSLSSR